MNTATMRSDHEIQQGVEALEARAEGVDTSIGAVVVQSKYEVLTAILDGMVTPSEVDEAMHNALLDNMDLKSFLHVQASRNAAAWAAEEMGQL